MDVVGVDGCSGGWIAAFRAPGGDIACRRIELLADLFEGEEPPRIVAVDVPIGLLARGARECDVEARRLLKQRRSSVFPAPIRCLLRAASHAEASRMRRETEGKGVSIQTWEIVPKIAEADALLRGHAGRPDVVREAHPEVSFYFLNRRRPMRFAKTTAEGRFERLSALARWCGPVAARLAGTRRGLSCQADDVIDALVALWTAERIAAGRAVTIPADPPRDDYGLRMEMVA